MITHDGDARAVRVIILGADLTYDLCKSQFLLQGVIFQQRPINFVCCLLTVLARVVVLSESLVNFSIYCSNAEPPFMAVAAMLSR